MPTDSIWVGIDAGKHHHHAAAIDSDGTCYGQPTSPTTKLRSPRQGLRGSGVVGGRPNKRGRRELLPDTVNAIAALVSDRTITW